MNRGASSPDDDSTARRAGSGEPVRQKPPARRVERNWTPTLISIFSVVVVFGAAAWFIGRAEQWPRIRRQFFNWDAMVASFPKVLDGFWLNLKVWGICIVAIGVWALVLTLFRVLKGPWLAPLRVFAIVYVDFFRGMPALLLIVLFGFGIPALRLPGLPSSALFWGIVAITLSYAAYATEVYRSGIDAVHDGQRAAAKSLGLTQLQAMRYAILPQAFRNVLPALLNLAIALQKDVAILSILGIRDAVREAEIYKSQTFNYSSYMVAAILFLVTTIPLARLVDYLTRRDRRRRLQGGMI
ncbi:MAG: amino acid ABC transporter permease [Bauldia sp.]|nr:amino acid ABC transporter permease [Bauldia sp.]